MHKDQIRFSPILSACQDDSEAGPLATQLFNCYVSGNNILSDVPHRVFADAFADYAFRAKYEAVLRQNQYKTETQLARDRMCRKVTGTLTTAVHPFVLLGRLMLWTWKNFIVFLCYMWTLFWAWKKGVCPYFRFEE